MAILGWAAFGAAVRFWQLGIEMRPFIHRKTWIGYPIFASISGAFGYYLQGVEERQNKILNDRREILLAKRARQMERDVSEECVAAL